MLYLRVHAVFPHSLPRRPGKSMHECKPSSGSIPLLHFAAYSMFGCRKFHRHGSSVTTTSRESPRKGKVPVHRREARMFQMMTDLILLLLLLLRPDEQNTKLRFLLRPPRCPFLDPLSLHIGVHLLRPRLVPLDSAWPRTPPEKGVLCFLTAV